MVKFQHAMRPNKPNKLIHDHIFRSFQNFHQMKGAFNNMFEVKDEPGQPVATILYQLDVTLAFTRRAARSIYMILL